MGPLIALLIAIGVGSAVAFVFWDDLVRWIQSFIMRLQNKFNALKRKYAEKLFHWLGDKYNLEHKLYYKENGEYVEEVTTRTVPESEVPDWAREALDEEDCTEVYEQELGLSL